MSQRITFYLASVTFNVRQCDALLRRLWEEGIQVRKLLFLREKDFKFLERLKEKFLRKARKFFERSGEAKEEGPRKAVARRSEEEEEFDKGRVGYEFKRCWKEAQCSWLRMYEYYKERNEEREYQRQERIAGRIIERAGWNKLGIRY